MADTFALPFLFDAVVQRFSDETTLVANLFGWRSRSQKLETGDRICWIPGDPDGDLGELVEARYPGRNPRPLATLDELFTVEIQGSDAHAKSDERAQYNKVRWIFDAWWRACYLAYTGRVRVVSATWLHPERVQFRNGLCIQAVCALDAMIPDSAAGVAPANTTAVLTVDELDVTQTLNVSAT